MTLLQQVRMASSANDLRVCLAAAMRLLAEQDREIDRLRADNARLQSEQQSSGKRGVGGWTKASDARS